ncbi:uncharacterized protein LOC144330849 [Macaca mulatta]
MSLLDRERPQLHPLTPKVQFSRNWNRRVRRSRPLSLSRPPPLEQPLSLPETSFRVQGFTSRRLPGNQPCSGVSECPGFREHRPASPTLSTHFPFPPHRRQNEEEQNQSGERQLTLQPLHTPGPGRSSAPGPLDVHSPPPSQSRTLCAELR